MKVVSICATHGRHRCAERALALFLNQTYEKKDLIIFQNSDVPQRLDLPGTTVDFCNGAVNNNVLLINDPGPFTSLGDIYTKALGYVPEDTDLITFQDDDDIFLPNHIEEGVKGYLKAKELNPNYKAYKPSKSYYRDPRGISLMSNTLEPSMFVEYQHIKHYGFSDTTTEQHLQWVNPLVINNEIYVDDEGIPTLIYNWGDLFHTYKTSGDYHNPDNFENCRVNSKDHGDGILTPNWNTQQYYDLVKNFKHG